MLSTSLKSEDDCIDKGADGNRSILELRKAIFQVHSNTFFLIFYNVYVLDYLFSVAVGSLFHIKSDNIFYYTKESKLYKEKGLLVDTVTKSSGIHHMSEQLSTPVI